MHRRAFSLAAIAATALSSRTSHAATSGIKIRFVIARTIDREQGAVETMIYENAVLVAESERFEAAFAERYRLALRPVSTPEGIRVEVGLLDLTREASQRMDGVTVVKLWHGGSIEFLGVAGTKYSIGLLVTSAPLPSAA